MNYRFAATFPAICLMLVITGCSNNGNDQVSKEDWKPMYTPTPTPTPDTGPAPVLDPKLFPGAGKALKKVTRYSDDERRLIFAERVRAEDKARKESYKMYPIIDQYPQNVKNEEMRLNIEDVLANKYRAKVAKKYKLSEEEFDSIQSEGLREDWPLPEY